MHIIDDEYSSPLLERNVPESVASMPRVSRVEIPIRSSTSMNSYQTHAAAKQANPRRATSAGRKKGRVHSLETVNPIGASDDTHYGSVQTSTDWPKTSISQISGISSREGAETPLGYSGTRSPFKESWVPLNSGIHEDSTTFPYQFPNLDGQPFSGNVPELAHEPKTVFSWDEPVTRMETPYADISQSPHAEGNSWSDIKAETERAAAEMAERDLAFAGKMFDSLSGTFGGSSTSTYPKSSFMTSNLSIVSYDSEADDSDSDTSTIELERVEARKTIEGVKAQPVRQIGIRQVFYDDIFHWLTMYAEFSCEQEQNLENEKLKSPAESSRGAHNTPRSNGNQAILPETPGRILYSLSDDGQEDLDDVEDITSDVGSSLLGHTGHSSVNLALDTPARGNLATTANGHAARRFKRLPAA
ncbi:hypothetical protein GGS21DRAFT_527384 [Xylaria nigripes]|nr:hypothetical protein GGS21DRAFT_527384 [Xylaria nigripes]